MTLPPGLWICLAVGVLWIGFPARRTSPGITLAGGLCTLTGLLTPCWWTFGGNGALPEGWWAGVAWWIGFSWTPHCGSPVRSWSPQALGWSTMTATGLLTATVAEDWVTLLLAMELVRQSTLPRRPDHAAAWEAFCPLMLTVALIGWVSVTGASTLAEWRAVLADSYAVSDSNLTIGRPSLILIGATVFTVCGIAGPVLWTWRDRASAGPQGSLGERLAATAARQLVSLLALQRLFTGGSAGLEPTWIVVLTITAVASWCLAIRWLSDPQRFDRAILGAAHFQWGTLLLWVCVLLGKSEWTDTAGELISSLAVRDALSLALLHHGLTFAALAAAATWLIDETDGASYFDQFRGLGSRYPLRTGTLLLLLASLIGLPMTAGFWFRWAWMLSTLGMHQVSADSSVSPHAGLRLAALLGVLTLAVVAGVFGRIARLMLFESVIGGAAPRGGWWPITVALVSVVAAVVTGLVPALLF